MYFSTLHRFLDQHYKVDSGQFSPLLEPTPSFKQFFFLSFSFSFSLLLLEYYYYSRALLALFSRLGYFPSSLSLSSPFTVSQITVMRDWIYTRYLRPIVSVRGDRNFLRGQPFNCNLEMVQNRSLFCKGECNLNVEK